MDRHFRKENIQMVNKHVKRSSVSLSTKEMHTTSKTTVRHHHSAVRTPSSERSDRSECGQQRGEQGLLHTAAGGVEWYNHFGKQFDGFFKKLNLPTL